MEDQSKLLTLQLLMDYLEYYTRRPSSSPCPPSSLEAAVMHTFASISQEHYQLSWTCYRQCCGNRVEMVANMMQDIFSHPLGPNWGWMVALLTFTGFLLERPPASHKLALKKWDARVDLDCQSLVTLLCACLMGHHRTWLEAHGSWDGFCRYFRDT
ncbi:PREDICTED: bcl-2-like protein 10 [Myotis davidii]|uniref:bcl-2-like protein 10 n=1 Tax=Myotis davidii TaxID=225400 RepID=UPI0003EBB6A9|nr:PREDICTED: bcl-2-like protein 10 [Myotis davidii]